MPTSKPYTLHPLRIVPHSARPRHCHLIYVWGFLPGMRSQKPALRHGHISTLVISSEGLLETIALTPKGIVLAQQTSSCLTIAGPWTTILQCICVLITCTCILAFRLWKQSQQLLRLLSFEPQRLLMKSRRLEAVIDFCGLLSTFYTIAPQRAQSKQKNSEPHKPLTSNARLYL